ncbi:MAG: hypothetical protein H7Z38_17785 [Rubrivivax sp.]|nr:hypothetical protein [Pyrinomonadaceae bacterium]
MTGLGEEIVTRCPTCGYGLTARRYAVPKECPLCRGSFEAEAAPAPQLPPAQESENEDVFEAKVKDAVAKEKEENNERGESRITLSVRPDVETGPLGLTTQRMPEPEEATPESEARARESVAPDAPLEAEILEPHAPYLEPASSPDESGAHSPHEASGQASYAPRDGQEPPQGAHIEHATPAASARAETRAFVAPATRSDNFQTPPVSSSQPVPQPAGASRARGSLEERVSPEVVGRYSDAYRTARATVLIGNLIKVFGALLGLLVGGGLFALVATQGRLVGATGVAGGVAGLLAGGSIFAFFFVLGVVISAQGQLTRATLDGAVNSSPFLTNDQRAEAMSLR